MRSAPGAGAQTSNSTAASKGLDFCCPKRLGVPEESEVEEFPRIQRSAPTVHRTRAPLIPCKMLSGDFGCPGERA